MQGIEDIKRELGDKTIMKKNDAPQFFSDTIVDEDEISALLHKYTSDPSLYKEVLDQHEKAIEEMEKVKLEQQKLLEETRALKD
jgi:hypothetical protein